MKVKTASVIACCVIGCWMSPAWAERDFITPSGRPDAMFKNTERSAVGGKIANQCLNVGWQITEQSDSAIVCEFKMNMMQSIFTQLALGNSYSTTPRGFVRFSVVQIGSDTRVQTNQWVETQMAFGQTRREDINNDEQMDGLMRLMIVAGGQPAPGSRMPGAYLGFDTKAVSQGRGVVFPVLRMGKGTPGDKAGLQVGDVVTKIDDTTFKDMNGYRKKMRTIPVGKSYPITILRQGAELTLTAIGEERPAWGTPEGDALLAQAASPAQPIAGPAPAN